MTTPKPDKSKILNRAWQIARKTRAETARAYFYQQYGSHAGQIRFVGRPEAEIFATVPHDLSAALKLAWFEARQPKAHEIIAQITASVLNRRAA